jgi:oligopeptide/dipeptide ABC transporter ATP-binding protein
MGEILYTRNLKVHFIQRRKIVKALDGVDIFLRKGYVTSLAGESGCGKTTLARTVLGFYTPVEGKVYFNGDDITLKKNQHIIRRNIQVVFQNPFLSIDPRYTVFSTLYETLKVFKKIKKANAESMIKQALQDVELDEEVMMRYPHQLSGGQVQRVCIARSLINEAPLIILDEPTSNLDVTTASKIIKLLIRLQEEKRVTFLFISHNLKLLKKISHFCFIMYYGKVVEYGPKELVYANPLHPYTKLLMEASHYQLKSLEEKEVPSEGCLFFPHCAFKKGECDGGYVKKEVEGGHFVFCNLFK